LGGSLNIQTTRFGQIELKTEDLIQFPEGILGFAELREFVLLDDPNDDIFAWLQSCEEPAIAENYRINLAKSDLEALQMTSAQGARSFCIVTIPDDPTAMTANMKAPIVINVQTRGARQCVLQDNALAIREPIFAKLQQRVVQNPTKSIKDQSNSLDVAVRLPEQTM
jgi:flagellar assembly factor FliW